MVLEKTPENMVDSQENKPMESSNWSRDHTNDQGQIILLCTYYGKTKLSGEVSHAEKGIILDLDPPMLCGISGSKGRDRWSW